MRRPAILATMLLQNVLMGVLIGMAPSAGGAAQPLASAPQPPARPRACLLPGQLALVSKFQPIKPSHPGTVFLNIGNGQSSATRRQPVLFFCVINQVSLPCRWPASYPSSSTSSSRMLAARAGWLGKRSQVQQVPGVADESAVPEGAASQRLRLALHLLRLPRASSPLS
jgi:hypothetical protein